MNSKKRIGLGEIAGIIFVILVAIGVIFAAKRMVETKQALSESSVEKTRQKVNEQYLAMVVSQQKQQDEIDKLEKKQAEDIENIQKQLDSLVDSIEAKPVQDDSIETKPIQEVEPDTTVGSDLDKDTTNSPEADNIPNPDTIVDSNHDFGTYIVQKGDTLSKISAKVSCSVDALAIYNEIKDIHLIYEGSVIRIPKPKEID